MSTYRLTLKVLLAAALLLSSCGHRGGKMPTDTTPAPPDYADSTQWYTVDRHAGVDIFYIVSTETGDYTVDGTPCHYADTYNDSVRRLLLGEMQGVNRLLSGDLNFYSPYYRQCTLQTFTADSLVLERIPVALGDVREAFS